MDKLGKVSMGKLGKVSIGKSGKVIVTVLCYEHLDGRGQNNYHDTLIRPAQSPFSMTFK